MMFKKIFFSNELIKIKSYDIYGYFDCYRTVPIEV